MQFPSSQVTPSCWVPIAADAPMDHVPMHCWTFVKQMAHHQSMSSHQTKDWAHKTPHCGLFVSMFDLRLMTCHAQLNPASARPKDADCFFAFFNQTPQRHSLIAAECWLNACFLHGCHWLHKWWHLSCKQGLDEVINDTSSPSNRQTTRGEMQ